MAETILYVFAHPDDETFGCGGTILHYSRLGKRQTLYCATRGEAGKTGDPSVCKKEDLASVRTKELQSAIDILGIDALYLQDHPDGKLDQVPFQTLVSEIGEIIEREKPEKVITFPPSGITYHIDHQIIQQATYTAVKTISHTTSLYYIAIPESISFPKNHAVHSVPDEQITDRIDITPYRELIYQAASQHRTQHLSLEKIFENGQINRTHECYQRII